jgi:hypothetical protein
VITRPIELQNISAKVWRICCVTGSYTRRVRFETFKAPPPGPGKTHGPANSLRKSWAFTSATAWKEKAEPGLAITHSRSWEIHFADLNGRYSRWCLTEGKLRVTPRRKALARRQREKNQILFGVEAILWRTFFNMGYGWASSSLIKNSQPVVGLSGNLSFSDRNCFSI